MTKKITIYIVDDHTLFREGLAYLLSKSDFVERVIEAENGRQFLQDIETTPADLILMDIEMPEMDGIAATKQVLSTHPQLKIIALSMYAHETYYTEMIDAGAKGFLLKNSTFGSVCTAINEVLMGNNYFSPEILESIIKNINKKKVQKPDADLTEREIEILYNICKGFSNAEIADMLFISKRTVDKHRENLLFKTDSKNTAGLVMYAIKNGFVET